MAFCPVFTVLLKIMEIIYFVIYYLAIGYKLK